MADEITPRASWTITLEFKSNDGSTPWRDSIFGEQSVTIQKKGNWRLDGGQRAVDECVALDMEAIIGMLRASGELVNASESDLTPTPIVD